MKVAQRLSSGVTIRQDFRDAVRFVFFETGFEGAEYGTHGGTAFVVNYGGRPYAITARHVLQGDFKWRQIVLTNEKFGDQQAGLAHAIFPSAAKTETAEGTEVLDLAAIRFADDVDVGFFRDTAYVLDYGTIAPSQVGDVLVVNGALKEKSSISPGAISPEFALLDFVDAGNSSSDPTLREAKARFESPPFQAIVGFSGSPVFNNTRDGLCGMVTRGDLFKTGDCVIWYIDIFDILKFLEAAHAGVSEFHYRKTISILERTEIKIFGSPSSAPQPFA